MRFASYVVAAVAATCLAGAAARADVLADYRFSATPMNSEPLVTQSAASSITPSGDIVRAGALGVGTPLGSVRASANITGSSSATDTAGAISAGDYIGFTLTPNPGYSLDLADLRFSWVIQRDTVADNKDPSPYTASVFLKSSAGGFTDSDPTLGTATRSTVYFGVGTGATENPWTEVVMDLSNMPTITTPLSFRLYFSDNGSWSNSHIRLDNLVVNGATVLPEPACVVGLGLAACLICGRRRRVRHSVRV